MSYFSDCYHNGAVHLKGQDGLDYISRDYFQIKFTKNKHENIIRHLGKSSVEYPISNLNN